MMAALWIILMLIISVGNICSLPENFYSQTFFNTNRSEVTLTGLILESIDICSEKCSCSVMKPQIIVTCKTHEIPNFPQPLLSMVTDLNLSGNHINFLGSNTTFKNLQMLNVSGNSIIEIDNKWLSLTKNLKILDLSNNFLLSPTIENVFRNPSLLHLNLSNNNLTEISDVMFHETPALLSLDLSFNHIRNISYNSFKNKISLEVLDLSNNQLLNIHHEWFTNLKTLKILNLKQNAVKLLRNRVFWPLNNLQHLDLSENLITSVGLLSFNGLVMLQFLNLSNNDIKQLQDGVFRSLVSLNTIDLSQNSFESTNGIFVHTPNLDTLCMKNVSSFKKLTPSSLAGLKMLKFLDVSGCKNLLEINLKAFSNLKNLRHLDLSYSNLSSLKMGVFKSFENIETVKLQGNPWRCDCYMYWILIWLGKHANVHLVSPAETFCSSPLSLHGQVLLDALDHSMVCTNATIHHYTKETKFKVGSTVFLKCQVEGSPTPSLTWITPQKRQFYLHTPKNYTKFISPMIHISQTSSNLFNEEVERFLLMSNGNLAIKNVGRGDGGFYTCIASNPLSNHSISIRLTLDYGFLAHIKIVSVLVGTATSFGFLLLTLISVLIKMILKHFGIKCPCRNGNNSPRTQQIKRILEGMEHYKKQQLDRLRDNYNVQVQRIKENCMQQMERLRESYSSQAERLRDIRDYGTLQIDRIRENYYLQVQRVRDYSTSQIIRLRENYIFQRNRIRKFSAHHLYKLRENYKLQQQHLNKILENLNIESCRNVCQRTDSVIFEPDITFGNVLVPKICLQSFAKETCDSNDNSSQMSAYFTPDEAGSEISGHESDGHDCDTSKPTFSPSSYKIGNIAVKVQEIISDSINIPENGNVQPDVLVFNKNESSDVNETIV